MLSEISVGVRACERQKNRKKGNEVKAATAKPKERESWKALSYYYYRHFSCGTRASERNSADEECEMLECWLLFINKPTNAYIIDVDKLFHYCLLKS